MNAGLYAALDLYDASIKAVVAPFNILFLLYWLVLFLLLETHVLVEFLRTVIALG